MTNPYESPTSSSDVNAASEFNLLRLLIFLLNFAVAAFFMISCVIGIVAMPSPGAFLGGLFAVAPFAVYTLCEWIAYYRQNRRMERRLGWANLVCAGFVAFGVVTNVGEAVMEEIPVDIAFLIWFMVIGATIIAYLAFSGWIRLRWTRSMAPHGRNLRTPADMLNPSGKPMHRYATEQNGEPERD